MFMVCVAARSAKTVYSTVCVCGGGTSVAPAVGFTTVAVNMLAACCVCIYRYSMHN